jgi:hypothetical protein
MSVVSTVHENVDERAQQQHGVGEHPQNVRSMFFPEEEHGNRKEHEKS